MAAQSAGLISCTHRFTHAARTASMLSHCPAWLSQNGLSKRDGQGPYGIQTRCAVGSRSDPSSTPLLRIRR